MSYTLQILAGNQQIGLLPASELLSSDDANPMQFGDVINSWVIYTKRTTVVGSPLGNLIAIMPNILDKAIPLATSFSLAESDLDIPNPDELEVVVFKNKDYYVIEDETLDFGLVDVTLHEVSEFHRLWDDANSEDQYELNSTLLAQFILGAAATGLAGSAPAPQVVPQVTPRKQPTSLVAAALDAPAKVSVSISAPSVSFGDNVQFAAGFLGAPVAASPASIAQSKLAALLNK